MRRAAFVVGAALVALWAGPSAWGQEASQLSIAKGPDLQAVTAGIAGEVTWTITVANTGETPLAAAVVTDPVAPACDRTIGDLAPGQSFSYECGMGGVVLAATDALVNMATATALDPNGQTIAASDDATVVAVQVAASAIIGDTVWDDADGDGIRDEGELGVPGVGLVLTEVASGGTSSATTNSDGRYLFAALAPGTYRVEPANPPGRLTTPASITVTLAEGQTYLDADFGLMQVLPATGFDVGLLALVGAVSAVAGWLVLRVARRAETPGP